MYFDGNSNAPGVCFARNRKSDGFFDVGDVIKRGIKKTCLKIRVNSY